MRFVLITNDTDIAEAAQSAFPATDTLIVTDRWSDGLDSCDGADLIFVDLIAVLETPHKIAGYEKFAHAKMAHAKANHTPLVLISPAADYELDFMTGWPNFVFAHVRRPISDKIFRRAATWV